MLIGHIYPCCNGDVSIFEREVVKQNLTSQIGMLFWFLFIHEYNKRFLRQFVHLMGI